MSNFLAIDTSGSYMTVLAYKNGRVFCSYVSDCAMKQSTLLMTAVDETLKKADMSLSECDFFAAVVGAGSFTGIRIGISAVKGFSLAYDKPSLPVTSFDVAAYNAIDGNNGKMLCLVDAMHDCYYACGYENGTVCYPPAYITEEEALALKEEGYALYACAKIPLCEKAKVEIVDPADGLQKAVLALAEKGAFAQLSALYVRKSSAELNAKV